MSQAINCLQQFNGCSKNDIRDSLVTHISVNYAYLYILDWVINPEYYYHKENAAQTFKCEIVDAPVAGCLLTDWTQSILAPCEVSYQALSQSKDVEEAC